MSGIERQIWDCTLDGLLQIRATVAGRAGPAADPFHLSQKGHRTMKMSFCSSLLFVLTALILAGCATSGRDFDSTKVSQIKKGETTEQQLVAMFGEPTQRSIDSEGMTHLTWQYVEARASGKNFIPIYGAFNHETDTSNKTLMVTLKGGIVTNYTASQGANENHMNG